MKRFRRTCLSQSSDTKDFHDDAKRKQRTLRHTGIWILAPSRNFHPRISTKYLLNSQFVNSLSIDVRKVLVHPTFALHERDVAWGLRIKDPPWRWPILNKTRRTLTRCAIRTHYFRAEKQHSSKSTTPQVRLRSGKSQSCNFLGENMSRNQKLGKVSRMSPEKS